MTNNQFWFACNSMLWCCCWLMVHNFVKKWKMQVDIFTKFILDHADNLGCSAPEERFGTHSLRDHMRDWIRSSHSSTVWSTRLIATLHPRLKRNDMCSLQESFTQYMRANHNGIWQPLTHYSWMILFRLFELAAGIISLTTIDCSKKWEYQFHSSSKCWLITFSDSYYANW